MGAISYFVLLLLQKTSNSSLQSHPLPSRAVTCCCGRCTWPASSRSTPEPPWAPTSHPPPPPSRAIACPPAPATSANYIQGVSQGGLHSREGKGHPRDRRSKHQMHRRRPPWVVADGRRCHRRWEQEGASVVDPPHPLASTISLEIFNFLVMPLYNSSRLHDRFRSMVVAFTTCPPVCRLCPSGLPPPNVEHRIYRPKDGRGEHCPTGPHAKHPTPPMPRGWSHRRTRQRYHLRCAG